MLMHHKQSDRACNISIAGCFDDCTQNCLALLLHQRLLLSLTWEQANTTVPHTACATAAHLLVLLILLSRLILLTRLH